MLHGKLSLMALKHLNFLSSAKNKIKFYLTSFGLFVLQVTWNKIWKERERKEYVCKWVCGCKRGSRHIHKHTHTHTLTYKERDRKCVCEKLKQSVNYQNHVIVAAL